MTPMHPNPHATARAAASDAVLDREETISRDELEALQLSRLQHTVAYAYDRVPLYKRKFDEAGVHPTDLRELSDLGNFPFTTKDDLRLEYPFGMFAVPQHEVARIHASSGTTGRATVVGYTKKDLADWAKLVARSLRASGVRPGMKVHNAYGYGLFTGGMGAHAGAEALGCTVIPISGGQTERQITAHPGLQAGRHPGHPHLPADHRRRHGAHGHRSRLHLAEVRRPGRRTVDRGDAARARSHHEHQGLRHLRPFRGHGPGRRRRSRGDAGRQPHLGGPLPPGNHRPLQPRGGQGERPAATANTASSSSPRSPRKPCRSSVTAPRTSPGCSPAPPGPRTAGWAASPAAATT